MLHPPSEALCWQRKKTRLAAPCVVKVTRLSAPAAGANCSARATRVTAEGKRSLIRGEKNKRTNMLNMFLKFEHRRQCQL